MEENVTYRHSGD